MYSFLLAIRISISKDYACEAPSTRIMAKKGLLPAFPTVSVISDYGKVCSNPFLHTILVDAREAPNNPCLSLIHADAREAPNNPCLSLIRVDDWQGLRHAPIYTD